MGELSLSLPSAASAGAYGGTQGNSNSFGANNQTILSNGNLGLVGTVGIILIALIGIVLFFR